MSQHFLLIQVGQDPEPRSGVPHDRCGSGGRCSARSAGPRRTARRSARRAAGLDAYDCRRPNGAPRFRCRECAKDFSITSGTLFASHKLPLRAYLAAIAIFCNEVKGKSMLAMSRDLGLSYKAAFVLCHKMREAMAEEMKGRKIGGDGQGGRGRWRLFRRLREARQSRARIASTAALARNQTGKRKAVVIVRERDGNSLPAVFRSEGAALSWIKSRIEDGTTVNADEAAAWNELHAPL